MGVYILYPTKRFVAKGPPVNFFDRPFVRSDGRTQNFRTDEKKSDEKKIGGKARGQGMGNGDSWEGFAPPDPPTTTFQKICPSGQIF